MWVFKISYFAELKFWYTLNMLNYYNCCIHQLHEELMEMKRVFPAIPTPHTPLPGGPLLHHDLQWTPFPPHSNCDLLHLRIRNSFPFSQSWGVKGSTQWTWIFSCCFLVVFLGLTQGGSGVLACLSVRGIGVAVHPGKARAWVTTGISESFLLFTSTQAVQSSSKISECSL